MSKRRGELTNLSALFAKYKESIRAPQQTVIDATVEVIDEVLGIRLDATKCRYTVSTRTLSTGAQALIKQEITKRHDEILAHVKGRLGEKSAPTLIL
jgi:hypothetical protein